MRRTHPIFNFTKDLSGSEEGSSESNNPNPKKPRKSGGFSESPTNIPRYRKPEGDLSGPVASSSQGQPDERLVLSVLPVTQQPTRRCSPFVVDKAVPDEGWKSKRRHDSPSTSGILRSHTRSELVKRIYDKQDEPSPSKKEIVHISVQVAVPQDDDESCSCWKGCAKSVSGAKRKASQIWNLMKEKKRKLDAWNPDRTHPIIACLDECDLSGLREALRPNKGICYRIYYVVMFLLAFSIGTKMGTNELEFQENSPVLHALDTKELGVDDLPAPTFTISPSAAFRASSVTEAIREFERIPSGDSKMNMKEPDHSRLLYLMNHVCEPKTVLSSRHGQGHKKPFDKSKFRSTLAEISKDDLIDKALTEKIIPFMKMASRKCADMLRFCSWNMKSDPENSCKDFKPSFETTGGSCSFNKLPDSAMYKGKRSLKSAWSDEEGDDKSKSGAWKNWTLHNHLRHMNDPKTAKVIAGPLRQADGGWPWGLSALVIFDEKDSACPQFDSSGTRITISVPGVDVDVERHSVVVPPNHEIFIRIYPEVTIADEDLITVPLDMRGCYMDQERNLTHYRMYTLENCHRECTADFILRKCGCVLLSFPNSADQRVCDVEELECVREAEGDLVREVGLWMACSHCLPTCSHMTLRLETTMTPYSKTHIPELAKRVNASSSMLHASYGPKTITPRVRKLRHSKYEAESEFLSIYESTNDWNMMTYSRAGAGLIILISAYISFRYFRYLRPLCCCCLLCRKLYVRICGLKQWLLIHPTRRARQQQAGQPDEESGGATNNENSPTASRHEFPRSTNFDMSLFDSSHITLTMPPTSNE